MHSYTGKIAMTVIECLIIVLIVSAWSYDAVTRMTAPNSGCRNEVKE